MKYLLVLFQLICFKITYSQSKTYDFSCMERTENMKTINYLSEIEQSTLRSIGQKVEIDEEIKYGRKIYLEYLKKGIIVNNYVNSYKINEIKNKLVSNILNPRGFEYNIYIINTKEINAFTCGGNIFLTNSIVLFCKNEQEIAAIICHEIAHNELNHLNDEISRKKTLEILGDYKEITNQLASLITTSFNQKNEMHCDFWGIDLLVKSGYYPCSTVDFWNRVINSDNHNKNQNIFFSSHPYSETRKSCCRNYLFKNYNLKCN